MNLEFSIGDLVIVEADSSSTGWDAFLDEVQGDLGFGESHIRSPR